MRQAVQLRIGAPRIESTEEQAHVVPLQQRASKLEYGSFAAAQRISVGMSKDDLHAPAAVAESYLLTMDHPLPPWVAARYCVAFGRVIARYAPGRIRWPAKPV